MDGFAAVMDMRSLEMLFKIAPRELRTGCASYLNDVAFAYRDAAFVEIAEGKKIRDARFVKSRLWVEKARPGDPHQMVARSGSVRSDRFTGWIEDYENSGSGRSQRAIGSTARGGSMDAKVKSANRLMPDVDLPRLDDFSGIRGDSRQRVAAMISLIARHPSIAASSNGYFLLHSGGWQAGLYRIKPSAAQKIRASGRKAKGKAFGWYTYAPQIQRVQTFKKDIAQKKQDWARQAQGKILDDQLRAWEGYIKIIILRHCNK